MISIPIGRFFRWRVARAYVVAAAVVGASLSISGPANAASRAALRSTDIVAPAVTNTTLTTSPGSPVTQGTMVTLTATVVPATAAGTVQFKDGTANLGDLVTVGNGTASETRLISTVGTRQLTAVFTSADPATFSSSTSPAVLLTVTDSSQSATIAAQQSGLSLDGPAGARGLTVLDLGGRGVTLLDGGGAGNGRGVTLLDLGGVTDGLLTDGRGLTVLDGRGLTVLGDGGSGGLLGNLLHGLL